MSVIIFPKKSSHPSSQHLSVNWSHPLTRGLVRAWPFALQGSGNNPVGIAAGGRIVTTSGTRIAWNPTGEGVALKTDDYTAQDQYLLTDALPSLGTNYSIVVRLIPRVAAGTGMRGIFCGSTHHYLSIWGPAPTEWEFDDGDIISSTTPNPDILGQLYQVAAMADGTNKYIYVDGIQRTSGLVNATTGSFPSGPAYILNFLNTGWWHGGNSDILDIYLYDRPLAVDELKWLRDVPLDIFKATRRFWTFDQPAGGNVVLTETGHFTDSITRFKMEPPFPRLGNYYLGGINNPSMLARWGFVVAGAESSIRSQYATVKSYNPDIKIIPYIASQEPTWNDPNGPEDYSSGFNDAWYLRKSTGEIITGWGGRPYFNMSDTCPVIGGKRWCEHLADWIITNFFNAGVGDGVFLDNAWDEIAWKDADLDLDNNGVNDHTEHGDTWINTHWANGMTLLYQRLRNASATRIIVGNGHYRGWVNGNGRMNEGFEGNWVPEVGASDWAANWTNYQTWTANHYGDHFFIISKSGEAGAGGQFLYQKMRFGLTTTLLSDGWSAYDESVGNHYSLWWYDEYSVNPATGVPTNDATWVGWLGLATGAAYNIGNGVWRRNYDKGIVLCNPTASSQVCSLGGTYKKIAGVQAPTYNDGSTVTSVTIPASDGILLISQFSTKAVTDSGSGSDAIAISRPNTVVDVGTATDSITTSKDLFNAVLFETGQFTETLSAGNTITIGEAVNSVENIQTFQTAVITVSETLSGSESVAVGKGDITIYDTITAIDIVSVYRNKHKTKILPSIKLQGKLNTYR